MSASLVGSEMCIRDRPRTQCLPRRNEAAQCSRCCSAAPPPGASGTALRCLLYTSDAADDM
eukprot:4543592-Alexandrium_andersonii.AAC.1